MYEALFEFFEGKMKVMNNDYYTEFFVEHIGSGLGSGISGSGCRTASGEMTWIRPDPDPQPWYRGSGSGS